MINGKIYDPNLAMTIIRQHMEMKQEKLEIVHRRTNISMNTLSSWKNGRCKYIKKENAIKYSKAYGLSFDLFLQQETIEISGNDSNTFLAVSKLIQNYDICDSTILSIEDIDGKIIQGNIESNFEDYYIRQSSIKDHQGNKYTVGGSNAVLEDIKSNKISITIPREYYSDFFYKTHDIPYEKYKIFINESKNITSFEGKPIKYLFAKCRAWPTLYNISIMLSRLKNSEAHNYTSDIIVLFKENSQLISIYKDLSEAALNIALKILHYYSKTPLHYSTAKIIYTIESISYICHPEYRMDVSKKLYRITKKLNGIHDHIEWATDISISSIN